MFSFEIIYIFLIIWGFFADMDNPELYIFNSAIRKITMQEDFLLHIQHMITTRGGTPCHIFNDTLRVLSELKETIRYFRYACQREFGRRIRKAWLERQIDFHGRIDLNWCCICHRSGCIFE